MLTSLSFTLTSTVFNLSYFLKDCIPPIFISLIILGGIFFFAPTLFFWVVDKIEKFVLFLSFTSIFCLLLISLSCKTIFSLCFFSNTLNLRLLAGLINSVAFSPMPSVDIIFFYLIQYRKYGLCSCFHQTKKSSFVLRLFLVDHLSC